MKRETIIEWVVFSIWIAIGAVAIVTGAMGDPRTSWWASWGAPLFAVAWFIGGLWVWVQILDILGLLPVEEAVE